MRKLSIQRKEGLIMGQLCKVLKYVIALLLLFTIAGVFFFSQSISFSETKKERKDEYLAESLSVLDFNRENNRGKHVLDIKSGDFITVSIKRDEALELDYYIVAERVYDNQEGFIPLTLSEEAYQDDYKIIPFKDKASQARFRLEEGKYNISCVSKDTFSNLDIVEIIEVSVDSTIDKENENDYFIPCD